MSSVHVRTSSRWDIRDATTPSPIPVRITPCHYIGHMLKNKATSNNQNRSLVVIPWAPLVPKFKPCKAIEVCLLNARSIKNKTIVLNDYVIENKIDVMAFTETWLLPGVVDQALKSDRTPKFFILHHLQRKTALQMDCFLKSLDPSLSNWLLTRTITNVWPYSTRKATDTLIPFYLIIMLYAVKYSYPNLPSRRKKLPTGALSALNLLGFVKTLRTWIC